MQNRLRLPGPGVATARAARVAPSIAPAASTTEAGEPSARSEADDILFLQRAAGNASVARLLRDPLVIQRQRVDLAAGGSVGEAPATNAREQVLTVLDRLFSVWSITTDSYGTATAAVRDLPSGSAVDGTSSAMSLVLAALKQNETGTLSAEVASTQLGISLSAAVGAGKTNNKIDILKLLDALHVEWHIGNDEYTAERAAVMALADTATVPDALIPSTIHGIAKLKRAVVAGTPSKKGAGGGAAPAGATAAPASMPAPAAGGGGSDATAVSGTPFKYRSGVAGSYRVEESERSELATAGTESARLTKEIEALKKENKKNPSAELKQQIAEMSATQSRLSTLTFRDKIEKILKNNGTDFDSWYGKIVEISFLGVPISKGVHEKVAVKLRAAEDDLLVRQGLKKEELGLQAKQGTEGLRTPKLATGGTAISLHCFGLAVDLNYANNPYIGLSSTTNTGEVIKRATLLITGTAVDALDKTSRSPGEAYDFLKPLSAAFKEYFALRGKPDEIKAKAQPLRDAGTDKRSDEEWATQIDADYKALKVKGADFDTHDPADGFLDFDKRVVLALTKAGLNWLGASAGKKDVMHFQLEGAMNRSV